MQFDGNSRSNEQNKRIQETKTPTGHRTYPVQSQTFRFLHGFLPADGAIRRQHQRRHLPAATQHPHFLEIHIFVGLLEEPEAAAAANVQIRIGKHKARHGMNRPSRINRPKFDDYGRRGFDRSPWKTNRDWGGPRSGRERGGRGGVRETKAHLRFSSAVALGFVRSSLLSVRLVTGPPIGDRKRRRNDAWPTTSGTTVGMTRYD